MPRLIDQYGDSIGLSVNQRKCAIINLDPDPHLAPSGAPFVEEYRYLGILTGLAVPIEKVFQTALQKLKDRARLFASIKTNFTSKVLLARIYLYPLVSYLLNFYSFPPATEKVFVSIIQNFIFPYGNLKHEILFASPRQVSWLNRPWNTLVHMLSGEDEDGQCHPLLEPGQPLKLPRRFWPLLEKLDKLTLVTRLLISFCSPSATVCHSTLESTTSWISPVSVPSVI